MNENHRENLSLLFSFIIIVFAGFVVWEFIAPLLWAGIIALATWPLYERILRLCRGRDWLASTVTIVVLMLVVVIPLFGLVRELTYDVQWLTKFLMFANQQGAPVPAWVHELPVGNEYAASLWQSTFGEPGGVADLLSHDSQSLAQMTTFMRAIGTQLAHRGLIFGFTILCLFFFYKDGHALMDHINAMGRYFLRDRWALYSRNLPSAINATLNGLVLVGLGVGIIMGIVYAFVGVPAPALIGALTAVLAMIPFGVPFAFLLAAILLITSSKLISALVVIGIGTLVMFIADHFIRPVIIGGATSLPFLAVLFGILGGVKAFGIIGLFLGPIIMVLFITLWHEADIFHKKVI